MYRGPGLGSPQMQPSCTPEAAVQPNLFFVGLHRRWARGVRDVGMCLGGAGGVRIWGGGYSSVCQ